MPPWTVRAFPLLLGVIIFVETAPPTSPLCPAPCTCASDITSCSGQRLQRPPFRIPGFTSRLDLSHNAIESLSSSWANQTLHRLTVFVLSRNSIEEIQENAFRQCPQLTRLDLSSNQLAALNSGMFNGLTRLQELLLFQNRVSHITVDVFQGLTRLQKLYLSGNLLTRFPEEIYKNGPRNLTFLDLSSNRLEELPVKTLLTLQSHSEIYLQDNPLICDCPVRALMEYWAWRRYRPVVDFGAGCEKEDLGCGGGQEDSEDPDVEEVHEYQVDPGAELSVQCPWVSGVQEGALFFWVTPHTVLMSSQQNSSKAPVQRFTVLSNGTLLIRSARDEDSGTYGCVAPRGRRLGSGRSLEVTVAVGNQSLTSAGDKNPPSASSGHFNTAFTTLASCVASIALVLLYLYTPCRCGRRGCGGRALVVCSDPREEAEHGQRRSNGKRVVFAEPRVQQDQEARPVSDGILKNGTHNIMDATITA